jgi:hypothetical protein
MEKVTQLPTSLVFLIDSIGACLNRAREATTVEEARDLVDEANAMLSIVRKLNSEALAAIGQQP